PTTYRLFHMMIFPLSRSHLLVENSLAVARPHRRRRHAEHDAQYINQNGFVILCAHCRRTEHTDPRGKQEWHWIPSYLVKTPAPISHGMCPTCISYYLKITLP